MKKEKQQKRPKRTKAQRVQALKTFAVDTVYDVVGSILFAIGVYTFAKSADFAPGGVSGLALICNYLWDLPIGTMTLIINIPIIAVHGQQVPGGHFFRCVYGRRSGADLYARLVHRRHGFPHRHHQKA